MKKKPPVKLFKIQKYHQNFIQHLKINQILFSQRIIKNRHKYKNNRNGYIYKNRTAVLFMKRRKTNDIFQKMKKN